MKKYFKYFFTMAALLVSAAVVSCEKDEQSNPEGKYTMTVNATKAGNGSKQLELDGNTLKAKWAVGEQVTVYKGTTNLGTLNVSNISGDGMSCKLTGSIDGSQISESDALTLKFLSSNYNSQNGTLAYIAANCDYAEADVTVASISGGNIRIVGASAEFVNKQSIVKFILKNSDGSAVLDNPEYLQVSNNSGEGTVLLSNIPSSTYTTNGNGVLFVAIPGFENKNVTVDAYLNGSRYSFTKNNINFTDGKYYEIMVKMTYSNLVDLSKVKNNVTLPDGTTVIGTLGVNKKISIADGATVTLNGVSINASGTWTSGDYAGLTCEGDAIIILSGENILRGIDDDYPGIHIKENKTLTIRGTGSLDASGNPTGYCYSAGIGGAYSSKCGNIVIEGGTITATGGNRDGAAIGGAFCGGYGDITISGGTVTATAVGDGAGIGIGSGYSSGYASGNITILGGTVTATSQGRGAGIGSGYSGSGSVGNILISGGTITATGGDNAAGIGSGYYSSCGGITIASTVTSVTATKGSGAPNSIGAGNSGTCGTVTILGTAYWSGSAYQNGGDIFLPTSPLYAHVPFGAVPGKFSIDNSRKVYISNGNLQYTKNTGTWSFMSPQYNTVETNDQNVGDNYSNQNIVSLFGWGTSGYDGKYPYATSTSDGSYAAVDLAGTNYDWGVYNTISNAVTGWRTLTNSEWEYLLKTRSYTSYSYAMGTIHSTNGMIIFPDEFNPTAVGVTITSPNSGSSGYVSYSDADWTKMEAAGCVFLPAAGRRPNNSPTTVGNVGTNGYYWTSTIMSNWAAHWWSFSTSGPGPTNGYRSNGYSVRLVKDAN